MNCSVPCIFTLLHYKMRYYSLEGNLQSVRDNLWATPQGLRVVHLVDTVINLVYSLVYIGHGYSAYCCVGAGSSLFTQSSSAPYSKPWKPVSGDGKSHSTNFCDRSIIMQTAVSHIFTTNFMYHTIWLFWNTFNLFFSSEKSTIGRSANRSSILSQSGGAFFSVGKKQI